METDEPESRYPKNFPIPPDKLSDEKLTLILRQELTEWKVVKSSLPENPFIEREELFREYIFRDFDQVLDYMRKVGDICNTLPHHPRWENTWSSLKVYLTTWDSIHIITYKDIMLARHMERIYNEYGESYFDLQAGIRVEEERKRFFTEINQLKIQGNLEQAFNKLSQFISQPGEIKERQFIINSINEFNSFLKTTRLQQLSDDEVVSKTKSFQAKLDAIIKSFDPKARIFFSYAWGGEKEKIVEDLYDSLKAEHAFDLVRDKTNLGYNSLISQFMKEIGKGSFVIVALSDKYLRSENCMFELYELYRNSNLEKEELLKKIFPIRVEPLDLSKPSALKDYFAYWKNREEEWKELVNEYDADQQKYRVIQAIRFSLTELLPFLNDINSMTEEVITKNDFAEIKESIRKRLS
jgi:pterin-4a-carbinolamine dehydratase